MSGVEIVPIAVSSSIVIYKITEIIVKKIIGKTKYKLLKRKIYKKITESFNDENIESLKEGLDLLKGFDEINGKNKLIKILEKLEIDGEKIQTVEELAEQFEMKHDKENEKSVIISQIDEYFDSIKSDFMKKINSTIIKE